ncbi:MAG: lysophospholipid acyltransferase family protein [Nitriliruptoraceae bacterium]
MSEAAHDEARVYSIAEERAARRERDLAGAVADDTRPRCGAVTAAGRPCRNYAVTGGRCRVHATERSAARGQPPRRPVGLAGATPSSPPPTGERTPAGEGAAAASGGSERAGSATEGSFAWAEQELKRRGFGAAVDGLELLRDAADDRFLDALRGLVAFLRRRVTGDYEVDTFGFDEDLTTHVLMPLLRPMHRRYWRVTSHGIEHVPTTGGGLLVANHAGTLPVDALITRLDVFDQTGRHARELGADLVFRTPFVGELARKTGATLASGDDADRLLADGELVAVWPEGYKGLGKRWADRYKLQRFGRGGFVATALRAQVPIVPTAIVGSEEIYPLLFDLRVVARLLGLPYFPVVAQMLAVPVLGPFALLPLPSRWIIEYGEPIETASLSPEVAEDPMALFDLTDQVRERIQGMLHRNLMGRRSVFL